MNVIGYLDRLSFEPGQVVHGRFSTTADGFTARLVRIILGDDHPLGPGPDISPVPSALDGVRFPGRVQPLRAGSFVQTAESLLPPGSTGLELDAAIRPTLPRAGHRQTIVSLNQAGVPTVTASLDEDGAISVSGVDGSTPAGRLVSGRWYRMILRMDFVSGSAELELTSSYGDRLIATTAVRLDASAAIGVVFAATVAHDIMPTDHFNGRIDSPRLRATSGVGGATSCPVAEWHFGPSSGGLRVVANRLADTFAGHSVNFPLRACLGIDGAPDDVDPRLTPEAYNAIHFHDDDLDDAGWEDDILLDLPEDLPSGVYGIQVDAEDDTTDTVPFVVVPTTTRQDIVVVLPTLSYLAYSCEHVMADPGARAYLQGVGVGAPPAFGGNKHDEYLVANGLRSLYDVHTDLSGVCFASTQKPLPNIRHDHRWAAVAGGPTSAHQFSADLHLISWLTAQDYDFDVITDEEVHRQGVTALSPYRVVLTGSHPEYPTTDMMKAYEHYLAGGGRVMYLGGNGFYWVTSIDPEQQHTMEIRRTAGIRAWQPEPGEWHHATTGELGGLWRLRGKAPQKLLGVGMASQGFDTNRPYDIVVDPEDPRISFVFDGVDLRSGRIGDFDSMVNGHGAAGVEIDRADVALGTPDDTIVLAAATGFSRAYGLDPVEVALPDGCYDGTTSERVRCDLVLVPHPNDGAVFSTGSIAWCGSLLVDDGANDVSAVTRNVLDAFLRLDHLPLRG
ncbi:hypothetical protein QOZ88_07665 [Blastococcus sp. BMG 814]|uniref:N,N-dimethylformamidase beta subunit-like C-terminal domain-containing protein n=1 Tax=Blastococcus carthaginiensis TaxID=3050034 RepID=A0ABT9IBG0_9ACTN|nr:N,N-dimethylformamidase beta subunit family domain-containing protein [Blastococcus carthaginiensis]MDP5182514.1 hypothetical protein [Blastococcus carthaginiensis]